MNRRNFINTIGSGALAFSSFAFAGDLNKELSRTTKIPLGLCNHSLRGLRLNARQLLEYAIEQKLDALLLNTLRSFENLDATHLTALGNLSKENNVRIYIGVGSISEKSTKFSGEYGSARELALEGIRVASLVGSPIVGCRIGAIEDRYIKGGIKVHIDAVVSLMKSLRDEALEAGIKFAFENHVADLRSMELLDLIHQTGTDICGALYDPANAVWAMEDPLEALKNLGSTVICTSVRDVHVWQTEDGATMQGAAIGRGMIDYPEFAQIMAENCPGVPLQVETISNSNREIPFLHAEFWEGFPNLLAADIVNFLKLIKKGAPQPVIQPPGGMDKRTFDIKLQESELLDSFDFLRNFCNAGMK